MTLSSHDPRANARLTGYGRVGFAGRYHAFRPQAPATVVEVVLRLAQTDRPGLVVDLGSGTGLSTVIWAARAERVIGVEPLEEMRKVAEAAISAPNVSFRDAVAQQTGLGDGAADVVTCSQSLHDMEPESTLAEIARILRDGGVFAAYDYEWPPVVHWEAELALLAFMDRVRAAWRRHGIKSDMRQWDKARHLERMRDSGRFRYARQLLLHHTEPCTAERWVGFALSIGMVPPVLALGLDDAELGLEEFRAVAERTLGAHGRPWHVSYRVCVAVK